MDINFKEIYDEIALLCDEFLSLETNCKLGAVTNRDLIRLWGLWRDFKPPTEDIKNKCYYLFNLIENMPEFSIDDVIRSFDYEKWIRSLDHIKYNSDSIVVQKGILEHLDVLDSALKLKTEFILDRFAPNDEIDLDHISSMTPEPDWLMEYYQYRGICEGAIVINSSYFKPITSHIIALSSFNYSTFVPSIYHVLNTVLLTESEWERISSSFSEQFRFGAFGNDSNDSF